jgi:nucleoid DNA-binding protein
MPQGPAKAHGEIMFTRAEAKIINEAATLIKRELQVAGDSHSIRGFGSFKIKTRAARDARNPSTGETVALPERDVLVFKMSKTYDQ